MAQLRKLHHSATRKAQAWSIAIGVIGALLLGVGMSFIMTDLGQILGSFRDHALAVGLLIGLAGILLVAMAYPAYNRVLAKERQRIAPEILRLTDELMQ